MTDLPEAPDWLNVSRETLDRLKTLCDLVRRWNPAINLVAKSTIDDIWNRHLLDSAQMFEFSPADAKTWLDLGSGAGFPGLVMAILALEHRPHLCVTLVESDRRKSVFLSEAIRQMGLPAKVLTQRIEDVTPQAADVVSARALSSLATLCAHAQRHLDRNGIGLFPKGVNAEAEIEEARRSWRFDISAHPSRTDRSAAILVLKDIRNA